MTIKTIDVSLNIKDSGTGAKIISKLKEANAEKEKLEGTEYRNARGVAGAAGGGSRDFAKQSQGLGGLVHVYATFAANIFAVATAYQALNRAAEVSRLEQTAELMSGKLGVSMKNLGKDIQEVTGYAVTMGEALQFSAMGTSAGLTGKQITNLVQIAKGAANALGRDVNDATRRIIQGTAKQEQEILDELGIFVKAKQAYEEYAGARGMKVDDLSAAQRVNAYAEAVAKAGEKWKEYSKIEDPFARLTATTKEAGQELLSVVNKVLVPLVSILGETKGLVEGILLLITAKLAKMAVPHLGDSLKNMFTIDNTEIKKYEDTASKVIDRHSKQLEELEFSRGKVRAGLASTLPATDKRTLKRAAISAEDAKDIANKEILNRISREKLTIEEAIEKKYLNIKKVGGEHVVNQTTVKSLAKEILTIKAQELAISEKITEATVARNLAEYDRDETVKKLRAQNTGWFGSETSANNKAITANRVDVINSTLANSQIGYIEKITGTISNLGGIVTDTEGKVSKVTNTFRMLGVVGSLAIRGIFAAMGPLMLAFGAAEILIKPILYYIGIFSEESDKMTESTSRFNDQIKASSTAWKRASSDLNEYISSVEQLDSIYATNSATASALAASIKEQENALKTIVEKSGEKAASKRGFFGGASDIETSASTLQKGISGILDSGVIKQGTKEYENLERIWFKLDNGLKQHNLTYQEHAKLLKESGIQLSALETKQESYRKELEKIVGPAAAAGSAAEAIKKNAGLQKDANIPQLRTAEAQGVYKDYLSSIEAVFNASDLDRTIAGSTSLIDSINETAKGLPDAAERVRMFGEALTMLATAKSMNNIEDQKAAKSKAVEQLMMLMKDLDKLPKSGREKVQRISNLDYELQVTRQSKDTLASQGRLSPSLENIGNKEIATERIAQLEHEKRLEEIALRRKKGELGAGSLGDTRAKELSAQSESIRLSAVQESQYAATLESQALMLKNAKDANTESSAALELATGYAEQTRLAAINKEKELAVLQATTGLQGKELELAKKKIDDKAKADQLTRDLGISASELLSMKSVKVGDTVTAADGTSLVAEKASSASKLFIDTFVGGLEAHIKELDKKALGPIEGTLKAFESGVDASMTTLMDSIQTGSGVTAEGVSRAFRNAASDIFKQMAIEQASLAVKKAGASLIGMFSGTTTASANGNIMTSSGPMTLNKYANGGIARTPQVSIFGEGRTPEAYVPLPDGRSIPVTMKAPGSGGSVINSGDTSINISIDNSNNASNSQSGGQSSQLNPAAFSKHLASLIKQEVANQKMPGGLLYTGNR